METALDTMIQEIEKRGGYVENKQKRENDKEYRQRMMLINTIVTELFVGDRETLVKMSNPDHPGHDIFATHYRACILWNAEIQGGRELYQEFCAVLN